MYCLDGKTLENGKSEKILHDNGNSLRLECSSIFYSITTFKTKLFLSDIHNYRKRSEHKIKIVKNEFLAVENTYGIEEDSTIYHIFAKEYNEEKEHVDIIGHALPEMFSMKGRLNNSILDCKSIKTIKQ